MILLCDLEFFLSQRYGDLEFFIPYQQFLSQCNIHCKTVFFVSIWIQCTIVHSYGHQKHQFALVWIVYCTICRVQFKYMYVYSKLLEIVSLVQPLLGSPPMMLLMWLPRTRVADYTGGPTQFISHNNLLGCSKRPMLVQPEHEPIILHVNGGDGSGVASVVPAVKSIGISAKILLCMNCQFYSFQDLSLSMLLINCLVQLQMKMNCLSC